MWFGTSNTFRLEDGTSGGGLVGGGGKLRRLNEGSAQADDSGAFGLALAGGLAGLLATGTGAASRPEAATPSEADFAAFGTETTDDVTFGPLALAVEAGCTG